MQTLEALKTRLTTRQSTVAIVGLGYVGLPLMLRFSSVGFKVLGIDVDPGKIAKINAGQSYIEHIAAERIAEARRAGCEATADFSRAAATKPGWSPEWSALSAPTCWKPCFSV